MFFFCGKLKNYFEIMEIASKEVWKSDGLKSNVFYLHDSLRAWDRDYFKPRRPTSVIQKFIFFT